MIAKEGLLLFSEEDCPLERDSNLVALLVEQRIVPIVIKPEGLIALNGIEGAMKFLETNLRPLGIGVIFAKQMRYKSGQWLEIYGPVIQQYPESFEEILNPLQRLNFKYPSLAVAVQLPPSEQGSSSSLDDLIANFKWNVVGGGEALSRGGLSTLRQILAPRIPLDVIIRELDTDGRLRDRSREANMRTFNGIHAPKSKQEAVDNLTALFTKEELAQIKIY